jgi:hypothetical protein
VEPHNHRVNAAERAIQTVKDAFIATPVTTDCGFLLQLWDKLALQVQDTLNLLQESQINPTILAYECALCSTNDTSNNWQDNLQAQAFDE